MSDPMSSLHALAYVYFGQDSDLFGSDPDSVVRSTSRGGEADLIAEIHGVMSDNPSENELRQLWQVTYRSGFDPASIGLTYREWFDHMLEVLGGHPE